MTKAEVTQSWCDGEPAGDDGDTMRADHLLLWYKGRVIAERVGYGLYRELPVCGTPTCGEMAARKLYRRIAARCSLRRVVGTLTVWPPASS